MVRSCAEKKLKLNLVKCEQPFGRAKYSKSRPSELFTVKHFIAISLKA